MTIEEFVARYPVHVIVQFLDEESVSFRMQSPTIDPLQVLVTVDDLLRDRPLTVVQRERWTEGEPRLLGIGWERPASVGAVVIAQGVQHLQLRAACLFIREQARRLLELRAAQQIAAAQEQIARTSLVVPSGAILRPAD